MFSEADVGATNRPAVVDGHVVLLPTLAGLMHGQEAVDSDASQDLWSTLAAAVMAEDAFADLEARADEGETLAEVVDLASRRRQG